MNVLWRLCHVCTSAQECPLSVALPVLGQETGQDQTTPISLTVVPNSKPNHAFFFFFACFSNWRPGFIAGAYPRGKLAYEHRCRFQWGQRKVAYDTGAFVVHGSLAQSRAGIEGLRHAWVYLCILVSLAVWWLLQKCNCEHSFIPVDAARSKKFTFS